MQAAAQRRIYLEAAGSLRGGMAHRATHTLATCPSHLIHGSGGPNEWRSASN